MPYSQLARASLIAIVAAAAAAAIAACAGGATYLSSAGCASGSCGSPSPSPSPSQSPSNCLGTVAPGAVEVIAVDLTENTCTDNTYQQVIGYNATVTPTQGAVIALTHSPTDLVQFENVDNQPHTAANLGSWTGSYPNVTPNPAATPSPKGMDISTLGFTAGNINSGRKSRKYIADVPGVYVFGCAYHYNSNNMRTVIIVQ